MLTSSVELLCLVEEDFKEGRGNILEKKKETKPKSTNGSELKH